jgi:hypothetical protein
VSVNLTAGPTTHEPTPIVFNVRVHYQDRAGRRSDVVAEGGPAVNNIAAKLLGYNVSGLEQLAAGSSAPRVAPLAGRSRHG